MASRTISVDEEAYALLKAAKIGDESFSDVVKRALSPTRPRVSALVGLLTEKEGARLERSVREMRKASAKADERRRKRLWD